MRKKLPVNFIKNILSLLLLILVSVSTANAQLVAVTGKYTGTGNNNNAIMGLGFKPDLLLINSDQFHAQLTTSTLPANCTKDMNGGSVKPGRIRSLDIDGFTLDDDNKVNKDGTEYNYLALKTQPGVLEMGSYTGDDMDDRNITGISFLPEMVIIFSEDNNQKPVFSSSSMGADQSTNFFGSGFSTNKIQAFNANGFQIGKHDAVNQSGKTYHYIAMKSVPGMIYIGVYSGDGSNGRVIPEPGIGSFVMVKREGKNAVYRNRDMPLNNSYYFMNTSSVSNRIKRNTTGGFEIGDDNEVNQSGKEYHYVKLVGLSVILPVKLISFDAGLLQEKVELQWEIATGQQAKTFTVERSSDLVNFEVMAQLDGNLNNIDSLSYHYTDTDPLPGYTYYRLKITDMTGQFEYSGIRKIALAKAGGNDFTVYPNPLHGNELFIDQSDPKNELFIDLVDLNGKKMKSFILRKGNRQVNFSTHLPAGIYYLIGNDGKTVVFRKQLVKQ